MKEGMKARIIDAAFMFVDYEHSNGDIVEMFPMGSEVGYYDSLGMWYSEDWFEDRYIEWVDQEGLKDFFTILTQASKQFRLSVEIDPEGRFTIFTPEADGPYHIYSEQGFKDFLKAYENLLEFKEEDV